MRVSGTRLARVRGGFAASGRIRSREDEEEGKGLRGNVKQLNEAWNDDEIGMRFMGIQFSAGG